MELNNLIKTFLENNNLPSYNDEKAALREIGELFYFKSGKEPLSQLPPELGRSLQNEREELVFFAGTFDPLHKGHLECISKCPSKKIMIVPDHNPWKEDQVRLKSPMQTYIDLLTETKCCVFPGFLGENKSNPTVDWITKVFVEKKYLLMGADAFMTLEKWKEPERLFKSLSGFYVLSRQVGHELVNEKAKFFKRQYPHLSIHFMEENPYEDLSSTGIRKNLLK